MEAKLVEFFAVVGRSSSLAGRPSEKQLDDVNTSTSPNGVRFSPCILTQFPSDAEDHATIHPKAICQFCFPRGLELSTSEKPPTHFTSILTDGSGRRHYVVVLTLTEQLTTLHRTLLFLGVTLPTQTNKKPNPKWLMDHSLPVYCPRALCIVSRYPFLEQFDTFLKQLVRISLSSAPVPMERYVANFCAEAPVPPRGMTSVRVTVADLPLHFQRPPPNQLPMLEPTCFDVLFRSLSIENVIMVWSCLLMEYKMVLCSDSISAMTPASLALLSLLFPFTWCGIYIPVLPHTLMDVLDAPVPFIVGVDAAYLRRVNSVDRPTGVVFVNLDTNEIMLGTDEETGEPRECPILPTHHRDKLLKHLNSLKQWLPDVDAHHHNGPSTDYAFFETVGAGFHGDVIPCVPTPIQNFAIESGVMSASVNGPSGHMRGRASTEMMLDRSHRSQISQSSSIKEQRHQRGDSTFSNVSTIGGGLEQRDGLVQDIRAGFLRFQTAVFQNYRTYIEQENGNVDESKHKSTTEMFDVSSFVAQFEYISQHTMTKIISTQQWCYFLQQRIDDPWEASEASVAGDAVRYFDEQIAAKYNRSILNRTKRKTPFLDDGRWILNDTFTVPLPSTQILPEPDDQNGERYVCEHGRFPDLLRENVKSRGGSGGGGRAVSWYGNIRTPRQLTTVEREITASGEVKNVLNRINTLATFAVGRRMTRSDYDQEVEAWEEAEAVKRASVLDFTNGYSMQPLSNVEVASTTNREHAGGKLRRKSDFELTADLVTSIQAAWRGHQSRNRHQRSITIATLLRTVQVRILQRAWRSHVQYMNGIVRIQSLFRRYPERQSFVKRRRCCVYIQSMHRSYTCRTRSLRKRREEVHRLRYIIVRGWSTCCVPLLQRSRFWTLQNAEAPSFLDVGMHRDEVEWLSKKYRQYGLSWVTMDDNNNAAGDRQESKASRSERLSTVGISSSSPQLTPPSYPNEHDSLSAASKALQLSRKDLYWRLKGKKGHVGLDSIELGKHFDEFCLSKLKKRKLKLSKLVWPEDLDAKTARAALNALCDSSARVILACVEDTDMDWAVIWRSHRVRVNLLESLRASLVALKRVKRKPSNCTSR